MITPTGFDCILPEYGHEWDRDERTVTAVSHAEAAQKAADEFCRESAEWPPTLEVHVRSTALGKNAARFLVTLENVPVFTAKLISQGAR